MKALVIGATGHFAGLVVPELKKRNVDIRALVRTDDKGQTALQGGADEFVIGDLTDKASLVKAAEGVDGVFHIIPAFIKDSAEIGVNMVEAAERAGVKKFVFSSVYHPSLSLVNHASKRPAQKALYESGMDYTILQPAMFMQILAASFKSAREQGVVNAAYSKHAKMSYVDYRDVAAAAAIAMVDDRLSNGVFELASPGMYDRIELADMIGKAIGKSVEAREITPEEWFKTAKMPDQAMKEGFLKMDQEYDKYGFSGGNSLILKTILGREPMTLQKFVDEMATSTKMAGSREMATTT